MVYCLNPIELMQNSAAIKVLIVDDHQMIRDGVKSLLYDTEGIHVTAEAENGKEAIVILEDENSLVDLILMDINMPKMDGIEATKYITQQFPDIKILALTVYDDESHIAEMLKAGASGYILKTTGKQELELSIKTIMADDSYFSKEVSNQMMKQLMKKSPSKKFSNSKLTERETEVLKLISDGYTNPEIAEKLFLSPRTIDAHRRNLLQKLQKKNTAGLVKYAMENDLA